MRAAKEIGSKSGVPYYTRGMIYDKKAGLVWPKDIEDEIYAGAYMVRRAVLDILEAGRETVKGAHQILKKFHDQGLTFGHPRVGSAGVIFFYFYRLEKMLG